MHDAHGIDVRAEVIRHQLAGQGVLSLPLERETDPDRNHAQDVDAHGGTFGYTDSRHADGSIGVPVEYAGLDGARHANAHDASLFAGSSLLRAQVRVIRQRERLVEHFLVAAAVVFVARGDRVGKLVRSNEVAASELRWIDVQMPRGDIHHLLEDEEVRRWAKAAIGKGRELVRGHQGEVILGHRNGVGPREGGQRLGGTDRGVALSRGAEIVDEFHPQAGDLGLCIDGERGLVVAIPRLAAARGEVLHAVFDPFDRSPAGFAGEQAGDVGPARAAFAAEAPAVRLALHVHLIRWNSEGGGSAESEEGGGLDASVDRQVEAHGVPLANGPKGFHGVGPQAIPPELFGKDVRRLGKGVVHRAPGEEALHHHVGALFFDDEGAPRFHRREGVRDGVERVVVDDDPLEGVLGDVAAGGGDSRYRLAHVAHHARCEAVGAPTFRGAGGGLAPAQRVFAGHHSHYAGKGRCIGGVELCDSGVGERAAQDRAVEHARYDDVCDELGASREKGRVLFALHAVPHPTRVGRRKVFDSFGNLDHHARFFGVSPMPRYRRVRGQALSWAVPEPVAPSLAAAE